MEAGPGWWIAGLIYLASKLVRAGPKLEEEAIPSPELVVKHQQVVAIGAVAVV